MRAKGVFITGTDTGVGKTVVSAGIIRALLHKGLCVGAMKPVETGCTRISNLKSQISNQEVGETDLLPSDGMFLREMAEMDDPLDLVAPVRLELPLAPMVASGIEQRPVDPGRIIDAYRKLSRKYDCMVVEGAGGLLVPIHPSYFMSDLMKELGVPVVVVARPALGTINHTLLTVGHALREGIEVLGVILNYSSPPEGGMAERTNPDALREICPVPVLGVFPFAESASKEELGKIAMAHIDLSLLP